MKKHTIEAMLVQLGMGLGERLAHSTTSVSRTPAEWRVQVHALAIAAVEAGVDADDPDGDVFMALVDGLAQTGSYTEALDAAGIES